jgi:hypothetical protein
MPRLRICRSGIGSFLFLHISLMCRALLVILLLHEDMGIVVFEFVLLTGSLTILMSFIFHLPLAEMLFCKVGGVLFGVVWMGFYVLCYFSHKTERKKMDNVP